MMRLLFILTLFGFTACTVANPAQGSDVISVPARPPGDYQSTKIRVAEKRAQLAANWKAATGDEKTAALNAAGKAWRSALLDDIIPHWYGTTWDFNGTTRTPGDGSIACGYFITTVLQDAGLNIERAKLAQQASSVIIKQLCATGTYEWISGKSRSEFLAYMKGKDEGLYLVGLDNHIGFLHHTPQGDWFIHASYMDPVKVVKETASESEVLNVSKVFVIGRISPHRALVEHWLTGEAFGTL